MDKKIIFIDIDGTLCNDSGLVPISAIKAIKEARKNEHLVYLCTGRSKAEISKTIKEIGFDGLIGAGGAYIESNGDILLDKKIHVTDLKELIAFLDDNKIEYYLESNHGLYASKNCISQIKKIVCENFSSDVGKRNEEKEYIQLFLDILIEDVKLFDLENVNKVSFINEDFPFEYIVEKFAEKFTVIRSTVPLFGENSGEIALKGVNKGTAIELLLQYMERDKKHTMALGDGYNDIEMFQYVDLAVAMGNAISPLKEIADDITETHDNDGIHYCFNKYKII